MFVFNRSVLAVLAPLALLLLVALWANSGVDADRTVVAATDQAGAEQVPGKLTLTASNNQAVARH